MTAYHITGVFEKFLINIRMPHDPQLIVATHHIIGFHTNPTDFIGIVGFIISSATEGKIVASVLKIKLSNVLSCLILSKYAICQVSSVIIYEILIQSSVTIAMTVDPLCYLEQLDPLNCLVKGSRGFVSNISRCLCNFFISCFLFRIFFT